MRTPLSPNGKAQAGLATNELTPDWAVVLPYWSCNAPGYRTVGLAFVSDGSEIQLLPGGPFCNVSISFFGISVKVQRSIVTSHDKPQVVIYNKTRSILYQHDMTRSLSRLFGEDEFKIYMSAELKKTKLHLMYRTEPQRW